MFITTFIWSYIFLFKFPAGCGSAAEITTANCPLRCPAGWVNIAGTGNNHCYLLPPAPVMQAPFWQWQSYCVSQQPTSYIVEANTLQELGAGGLRAASYFTSYITGTYYLWFGVYYENGAFHNVNGEPWVNVGVVINPLDPPKNGSCVFIDPKSTLITLSYHSCDDPLGATVCEMSPLPDCSGKTDPITTTAAYTRPDCDEPKSADFVRQQQNGYLAVADMLTLTGLDVVSCGLACLYYPACFSFDISDTGDCRLLDYSNLAACGGAAFTPDDSYQHYDKVSFSS